MAVVIEEQSLTDEQLVEDARLAQQAADEAEAEAGSPHRWRQADSYLEGRAMFKRLIDAIYATNTWDEARQIVEQCDGSIKAASTTTPTIPSDVVFSAADEELFDRFWKESARA